ncbi:hypothetical protein ACFLSX_04695 [Calditrichota bacterium]
MKFIVILLSVILTSMLYAQDNLKIELSSGKYILIKGYQVEEDTLIARSPEKEKELALFQNKFLKTLDENNFLKQKDTLNFQQIDILKNVLSRKDFIITKQDSLIIQLENLARPKNSAFVRFLKDTFDRKMMFFLGFIGGVYAGVAIN